MITVSKPAGATLANEALSFWYQDEYGSLADVFAVSIKIDTAAGGAVLAKTTLSTAAAPGGNRVGIGHYAYAWAPGASAAGAYVVTWFYRVESGSDEQSFSLPFELTDALYPFGPHYTTIYALREEGLTTSMANDAKAQAAIVRASRFIDHLTGRTFEARRKTVRLDGTSSRTLLLNEPIAALENVEIADEVGGLVLLDNVIKVYNRHLRENLWDPDDRNNPKLEFIHGNDLMGVNEEDPIAGVLADMIWPRGQQNIYVTGVFGFTEPDGSFIGGTPALIQEAAKLLVFRNLEKMVTSVGAPTTAVIQETTRDQTVIYAQPGAGGDNRARGFTGNAEIDQILLGFVRGPRFGAA